MPKPDRLRILLVGNYAPDRQQSMLRFGEVMLRELKKRSVDVTLLQPEARWLGERHRHGGLGKWLGYVDKLLRFPAQLRKAAAAHDVVHLLDHANAPYCHHLTAKPHLVTCHDLLAVRSARGEFPEHHTRWSGRRLQDMILRGIQHARLVACVSQATLADVQRVAGLPSERVVHVANGLNHPYRPMIAAQVAPILTTLGLPGACRYVLHVGGNHWYKNRDGVLRIVGALRRRPGWEDLHLVMAGEALDAGLQRIGVREGFAGDLHAVTNPDNHVLNALYSGALGLVFPSLHEGFGWPIIEAQASGCPAFVSDRPPLPEIAGEHAVQFDPLDPDYAAECIEIGLSQRHDHVGHALRNARRFTTKAMIDGYLELYRRVLA